MSKFWGLLALLLSVAIFALPSCEVSDDNDSAVADDDDSVSSGDDDDSADDDSASADDDSAN